MMADQSIDTDTEFEEAALTRVTEHTDGYEIRHGDAMVFYVSKEHGVAPHVGDRARFYGRGFGYPVRGLSLNGRVVFYRTDAEDAERHRRQIEADEQKRRDDFEREGRAALDADYLTLPAEFKARLDGFRRRNPDFRWQLE